ncbi:hypothetical protein H5410_040366 [Solanum commersonii]|uniref:Uncharacterized protein n=1 Tax=Solanum commersonii TaxID=4109 RepID=A0A9J5XR67_SOLCO|nr:hypothetical protein H5410_040366 [Solanum commersonii]
MKTTLAPKALAESLKGETMLMQANHEHSSIFRFDNITQPFASHSERSQVERVVQFPDGQEIFFTLNVILVPFYYVSLENRSQTTFFFKNPEEAEEENVSIAGNLVDNNKGKVTGVDFSGNIPKVFLSRSSWQSLIK